MRLLIAEDELALAEALTVFFEKNHFSVDAVHNGFDAYEYASTGEYDAVILDVMMPKLDGIQVLERLRQGGGKNPPPKKNPATKANNPIMKEIILPLISAVYTTMLRIINSNPNIVPCALLPFICTLNVQIPIPSTNQISFERTVDTA